MFVHVPMSFLCITAPILGRPKIPNDPSRTQQMTGCNDGGTPVIMYEMQANREQGREMGSKYSHLMLQHRGFDGCAWNVQQREACNGQQ